MLLDQQLKYNSSLPTLGLYTRSSISAHSGLLKSSSVQKSKDCLSLDTPRPKEKAKKMALTILPKVQEQHLNKWHPPGKQ